MKNFNFILFLITITLIYEAPLFAASTKTTPPTSPTESSKPLPTLQTVKNIDTVLTEKVQEKIVSIPSLKGQSVSAVSHEQTITLEGSVETKQQEEDAINAVKAIEGVKEVKSQLTIKGLQSQ